MAARAQHQEAERPHDGDDHQGQKHLLPAVVCEREIKTRVLALPTFYLNLVVIATSPHGCDSTWYLRLSVPLKIDVKISKQHAGKEINGSFSRGKDAFGTDNDLMATAWERRASTRLNPSQRLFVERRSVKVSEITAVVY